MSERERDYAAEVRNLLDAGLRVIRRFGTSGSPRVVDIVTDAGSSTDAFYRHFRSKDELVTTILEEGTARLHDHLITRMEAAGAPEDQVRSWVTAVLGTAASERTAADIRAVLWNAARVADDTRRRIAARETLAGPLVEPLTALGSVDPRRDALTLCHATFGRLEDFLWTRQAPSVEDTEHLVRFGLRVAGRPTSTKGSSAR